MRSKTMMIAALQLASLGLTACGSAGNGVELGSFEVVAERLQTCAETGLFAMPKQASYQVQLRQVGHSALHWRERTVGLLTGAYRETDGSFEVRQYLRSNFRDNKSTLPPCSIDRTMTIAGKLTGDSLTGTLAYRYSPTQGSSCGDLITGAQPLASALPCTIEAKLDGHRAEP